MVYYDMKNHILYGYEKSNRKNKKYNALLLKHGSNKLIRVPFGDNRYENFHDLTGLNAYPHLIHGDKNRRSLYRKRHKRFVKTGFYSPGWFAYNILW